MRGWAAHIAKRLRLSEWCAHSAPDVNPAITEPNNNLLYTRGSRRYICTGASVFALRVCRLFEEELPREPYSMHACVCSLGACSLTAGCSAQNLPCFSVLSKFIDWSPEKLGGIDLWLARTHSEYDQEPRVSLSLSLHTAREFIYKASNGIEMMFWALGEPTHGMAHSLALSQICRLLYAARALAAAAERN